MESAEYKRLKAGGRHSRYELGGYTTYNLLILLEELNICSFPPVNPEDLDNFAWRVHGKQDEKEEEAVSPRPVAHRV